MKRVQRMLGSVEQRARGFTLIEMMVSLTVGGIVMAAVVGLLTTQTRTYMQERAMADASESLRGAGALLSWELRHASMAGDTLSSIAATTVTLRSVQGVGIVCAKNAAGAYGIWKNGGDILATADDSALVFKTLTQKWKKLKISQVGTPVAMGLLACAWAGGRPPDLVVRLVAGAPSDTSGILVGSSFRAFRRVQYSEYQETGRWWLGRKVGAGAWEKVTGPLLAPASNGLGFTYYDSAGVTTAVARNVRVVGIALRAEAYRRYLTRNRSLVYGRDSMITRVLLRP
jgi:prepilin-type N-terminal cleavage/methylation domain-containing protein